MGEEGQGAILADVRHDANLGDTNTILESVGEATRHLHTARSETSNSPSMIQEVVTDKGEHCNNVLNDFDELNVRTYCSEPDRRNWKRQNGAENQTVVYANRRRIRGERGKRLLARRGEFLERMFAHCYETGGMRRLHVRGFANITKRLLRQAEAFELCLIMRKLFKARTLRGYGDLVAALWRAISLSSTAMQTSGTILWSRSDRIQRIRPIAIPA